MPGMEHSEHYRQCDVNPSSPRYSDPQLVACKADTNEPYHSTPITRQQHDQIVGDRITQQYYPRGEIDCQSDSIYPNTEAPRPTFHVDEHQK